MNVEFVYFRDADKIIRRKKLIQDVKTTMNYVADVLTGTIQRGELLRQALEETGWREEGVPLNILDGRRYQWKGIKRGVALEGSFSSYEYLLTGLARLQISFDKKMIDAGILMLTSARSEKSSLGTSRDLAVAEVEAFYPTISVPVAIALFDLGPPIISDGEEEGGDGNGVSVPPDQEKETSEIEQGA
jgi:hypothetical protein